MDLIYFGFFFSAKLNCRAIQIFAQEEKCAVGRKVALSSG